MTYFNDVIDNRLFKKNTFNENFRLVFGNSHKLSVFSQKWMRINHFLYLLMVFVITFNTAYAQDSTPSSNPNYGSFADYVAIIFSITAIIVSAIAFNKTRPIERLQFALSQKHHDKATLIRIFDEISSSEAQDRKDRVIDEFWKLKDENTEKILFPEQVKSDVKKLIQSFDGICALYDFGIFEYEEKFVKTYDGHVIRFWKMLKDEIEERQKLNPEYAGFFTKVSLERIKNWDRNHPNKPEPEPYRVPQK